MDLCLMIEGQEGVSWEQWRALARACEEHSIPALFRSDHYMNLDGNHPERQAMDAWATLSALSAVTSRVRLGTLVSPATFRHPSNLAKLVATVDEISGGRVELGLGAGWHEGEHEAYGFSFQPRAYGWIGWPSSLKSCSARGHVRRFPSTASTIAWSTSTPSRSRFSGPTHH